VQFVQALHGNPGDLADLEFLHVAERYRHVGRGNLRHGLVDDVLVPVQTVRFADGNSRRPQGTSVLVSDFLQRREGLVVEHILRATQVRRVNGVLQVHEVAVTMLFAPVCEPPVDSEEPAAMTGVAPDAATAVSKPVGWLEPYPLVSKSSKPRR